LPSILEFDEGNYLAICSGIIVGIFEIYLVCR